MEQKEGQMLLKLAEDVDFLRKYIVHPNKNLEIRVKELQQINDKLREIVKILAEDRVIFKKELMTKTERLGSYAVKNKVIQDKLIQKDEELTKLSKELKDLRDFVISLRSKKLELEIDTRKKKELLEKIEKKLEFETFEKRAYTINLAETIKVLESQINLIKKEKDDEMLDKRALQDKLNRVMEIVDKQNKLLEDTKIDINLQLAQQKKHYEGLMDKLNQDHVKEIIDKKSLVISMKKRLEILNN
ncbi:hypothetical protein KY312_03500, partial [Candidatus Woesearchaeota archaeon]|nr:hypothetical protein [Candidatus Woesearchaeota archaeon]